MGKLNGILKRSEIMKARTRLSIVATVSMCLLLAVSGLVLASDCYTAHGHEWSIKKYVLQEGCNNPVYGARVILYSHESSGVPGSEVFRGFTNHQGLCDLGEWEEGYYSVNVSWNGYYNCDPVFFLDRDRVFYNYLTIPPKCVCVTKKQR